MTLIDLTDDEIVDLLEKRQNTIADSPRFRNANPHDDSGIQRHMAKLDQLLTAVVDQSLCDLEPEHRDKLVEELESRWQTKIALLKLGLERKEPDG